MYQTIPITIMENDANSIESAPQPITPACFKMAGIAILPIAEAPVKNFVASTQLFPESDDDPPKNNKGIGRSTYIITVIIGHQLSYKAHDKIWSTIPPETKIAKRASFPL